MKPIPISLREVVFQFEDADEYNVASDLAHDYTSLVRTAWDGSMCEDIAGRHIPLADAIQRGIPEFDAAVLAYNTTVLPQIASHYETIGLVFDSTNFIQEILHVFKALKELNFTGFRTVYYDHIQAVLTNSEEVWRRGSFKDEVFLVQQFAKRIMNLTDSLRQRTGQCIANDEVSEAIRIDPNHTRGLPREVESQLEFVYNEAAGRIYGSRDWPQCVIGPFDWNRLFGEHDYLTPRMAARIHHTAIVDAEFDDYWPPRLPNLARPFFKHSKKWRESFRDCYVRIGMRLQKGLLPEPNCTGEEMAFHHIMRHAPDADDAIGKVIDALPEKQNDDDYEMVKDKILLDDDVMWLFDDGNADDDDDDDDDKIRVDKIVPRPGSMAAFAFGPHANSFHIAKLHPSEWFHAFSKERFRDHLPSA